jgi:hypothetical protein
MLQLMKLRSAHPRIVRFLLGVFLGSGSSIFFILMML